MICSHLEQLFYGSDLNVDDNKVVCFEQVSSAVNWLLHTDL